MSFSLHDAIRAPQVTVGNCEAFPPHESELVGMALVTATMILHPSFRLPVLGDLLAVDFVTSVQELTTEFSKFGSRIHRATYFRPIDLSRWLIPL